MRIFRPPVRPKRKYTKEQKAQRRSAHIAFLHDKGYSLDLLNSKSDKYLWQMRNRYGPQNGPTLAPIQRPKSAL